MVAEEALFQQSFGLIFAKLKLTSQWTKKKKEKEKKIVGVLAWFPSKMKSINVTANGSVATALQWL